MCPRSLRPKFKSRDGVHPFGPRHDAPSLDNTLIRDQFEIPADDMAAEDREGAANLRIDFGGSAGERSELFGIQQGLVKPLRACCEIDLLVNSNRLERLAGAQAFGHALRRCRFLRLVGLCQTNASRNQRQYW